MNIYLHLKDRTANDKFRNGIFELICKNSSINPPYSIYNANNNAYLTISNMSIIALYINDPHLTRK